MSSDSMINMEQMKPNLQNLYREEMYTDLAVAQIRKLIPITPDGADDTSRKPIFLAQTHVMTPGGAIPISAKIESDNLRSVLEQFPKAIEKALQEMIDEAHAYQREEANRIVIPDAKTQSRIQLG